MCGPTTTNSAVAPSESKYDGFSRRIVIGRIQANARFQITFRLKRAFAIYR